ncbi:MAG TPA: DUF2175 family protein [Elusimicrobiota bacterium]|nr:DUF2175 family protein [Elusimicrobiota bacterium]
MSANSPWSCSYCQSAISWDQLFTFTKAGAAHLDCFKKDALGRGKSQAALDLLESELKLLVAYKNAAKAAPDGELKALLETNGKETEKHAAVLTKHLATA